MNELAVTHEAIHNKQSIEHKNPQESSFQSFLRAAIKVR